MTRAAAGGSVLYVDDGLGDLAGATRGLARALGIPRTTLVSRAKRLGLL